MALTLPSLKHLHLENVTLKDDYDFREDGDLGGDNGLRNDGDWQPLVAYLEYQLSSGQPIGLRVNSGHRMSKKIRVQIKNLATRFEYTRYSAHLFW